MVAYNGIIGIDDVALNRFITGVFEGARGDVFHGAVPVAQYRLGHLEQIEFEVATAPHVTLAPPEGAGSQAAFGLVVDDMTLTLHYSAPASPTTLTGRLYGVARLISGADGILEPELMEVTVEITDNPALVDIITEILVPFVVPYVNRLLKPIRVPPMGYRQVVLSPPAVRAVDGRLLITSAIAPATAELALPGPWPDGRLFVAADTTLINQALVAAQPDLTTTGRWSKTLKFLIGQSTVKADYQATVADVSLDPAFVGSDLLTGKARVAIHVHTWAKRLFDAKTDAVVDATLTARPVFDNGWLAVKLVHLDRFAVHLELPGVPRSLDKQVSGFINGQVSALADPLSAVMAAQPAVQIKRLPSHELDMLDAKLSIGVSAVEVTTFRTPDGHMLVMASAIPEVHAAP
jgi:hypothetical protein